VLAKSVTPSRIEENRNILKLESSDIEALDNISKTKGTTRYVWPPFGVSPRCKDTYQGRTNLVQVKLGFPDKD